MNLNCIPVVGWIITFVCYTSLALPFWIGWTCIGIGQRYFAFLPSNYQVIGFWDCVWLFVVFTTIKSLIYPNLSISNTAKSKGKE